MIANGTHSAEAVAAVSHLIETIRQTYTNEMGRAPTNSEIQGILSSTVKNTLEEDDDQDDEDSSDEEIPLAEMERRRAFDNNARSSAFMYVYARPFPPEDFDNELHDYLQSLSLPPMIQEMDKKVDELFDALNDTNSSTKGYSTLLSTATKSDKEQRARVSQWEREQYELLHNTHFKDLDSWYKNKRDKIKNDLKVIEQQKRIAGRCMCGERNRPYEGEDASENPISKDWRCPPPLWMSSTSSSNSSDSTSATGKRAAAAAAPTYNFVEEDSGFIKTVQQGCECHTLHKFCTAKCKCLLDNMCDNIPPYCTCTGGACDENCVCIASGRPCNELCKGCGSFYTPEQIRRCVDLECEDAWCDPDKVRTKFKEQFAQLRALKEDADGGGRKTTPPQRLPATKKPATKKQKTNKGAKPKATSSSSLTASHGCGTNPWNMLRDYVDCSFHQMMDETRVPLAIRPLTTFPEVQKYIYQDPNADRCEAHYKNELATAALLEEEEDEPEEPELHENGFCECHYCEMCSGRVNVVQAICNRGKCDCIERVSGYERHHNYKVGDKKTWHFSFDFRRRRANDQNNGVTDGVNEDVSFCTLCTKCTGRRSTCGCGYGNHTDDMERRLWDEKETIKDRFIHQLKTGDPKTIQSVSWRCGDEVTRAAYSWGPPKRKDGLKWVKTITPLDDLKVGDTLKYFVQTQAEERKKEAERNSGHDY